MAKLSKEEKAEADAKKKEEAAAKKAEADAAKAAAKEAAAAKKAAVVETSSEMVCVRWPMEGTKVLWQTNHSNCYPGWMGYAGYNMVADQVLVNELTDISTIHNWQDSLGLVNDDIA